MKNKRQYIPSKRKGFHKRKRHTPRDTHSSLEDKVSGGGGRTGFGLDSSEVGDANDISNPKKSGVHGNKSVATSSTAPRIRLFQTPASQRQQHASTTKQNNETITSDRKSNFSLSSCPTKNPYLRQSRPSRPSNVPALSKNTAKAGTLKSAVHIVCAISENLARETCVASLDAGSPLSLHVTKQGNGQTYAETLAYLEILEPHEILLNEGRRNSQLARKVLALYNTEKGYQNPMDSDRDRRRNAQMNRKGSIRQLQRTFAKNASGSESVEKVSNGETDYDQSGPCSTSTIIKFVPRCYFDQTKGATLIRKIARKDTYDFSVIEEYILLSSSYAVLQYTQLCLGANLTKDSVDLIVNSGGNNRMAIDRSTLLHLELLANAKTGKMANSLIGTIDCTKTNVGSRLLRTNLMAPPIRVDTINTRLDLVDTFLGEEEFFYTVMEHLEALPDIEKMLTNIALVPWTKSKSRQRGEEVTTRVASKGISALVCIKSTLSAIPAFATALEEKLNALELRDRSLQASANRSGNEDHPNYHKNSDSASITSEGGSADDSISAVTEDRSLLVGLGSGRSTSFSLKDLRHQLLRAVLLTMKQPALTEILSAVSDIFTESTTFCRNAHAMRHQECFALKPNTDGMMDILRKAFLANVDDIYRLADEYAEKYGITVTVKETTSRGYYLSVPMEIASDLPEVFIQPVKSGKFIHCTTEEVHSLNARAQESVQDLLLMTHERIQEVLDIARSKYDALASFSDAIALLDMCHCFADNVASSRLPWCRPVVTDGPTIMGHSNSEQPAMSPKGAAGRDIAIRNGRYGINIAGNGLAVADGSAILVPGDFIPNDTYASEFQNFTVITGVNGSGKSTYLKQIAIISVLAHCGSYVPAEEAFIPIRDRLCTRIGTTDDQEHNISTFMLEMKETAFICNKASPKSLILIDELGRATSNEDGVAIAWSVAEFLLEKRAMTFFVTHYPQLCKLGDIYPTVSNQHMAATIASGPGNDQGDILYTHKIVPGSCKMATDYGVEMAATCGWPQDVITEARSIRSMVDMKLPDGALCQIESGTSESSLSVVRRKAGEVLQSIASHLVALKDCKTDLSSHAKCAYLQDMRDRLVPPQGNTQLIASMKRLLLDDPDQSLPSIHLNPESLNPQAIASHESNTKESSEPSPHDSECNTKLNPNATKGSNTKRDQHQDDAPDSCPQAGNIDLEHSRDLVGAIQDNSSCSTSGPSETSGNYSTSSNEESSLSSDAIGQSSCQQDKGVSSESCSSSGYSTFDSSSEDSDTEDSESDSYGSEAHSI